MDRATIFHRDPAAQARAFEQQGFEYLHIVDLDGAFAGKPMNGAAVDRILETVNIPMQLGGGIRDTATVEAWLEKGVSRVIIGTAAVRDPPFVKQAARDYPGQIAVGLDARAGNVAVEGWAQTSDLSAIDIARRFEDVGVSAIVFTDIARDGMSVFGDTSSPRAGHGIMTIWGNRRHAASGLVPGPEAVSIISRNRSRSSGLSRSPLRPASRID